MPQLAQAIGLDVTPRRRPETMAATKNTAVEEVMEHEATSGRAPSIDWPRLVASIQARDEWGLEELYRIFSRGIRFYLCRQLGPYDLDDKVHDSFLIIAQAIQRGDIREPERLMGYIRTVVRRQVAGCIDKAVHARRDQTLTNSEPPVPDERGNHEEQLIDRQEVEIMRKVLKGMPSRDREILERFYLREQPQEQICEAMGLSSTQFRLLKSRAKARFGEQGKKTLLRRAVELIRVKAAGA